MVDFSVNSKNLMLLYLEGQIFHYNCNVFVSAYHFHKPQAMRASNFPAHNLFVSNTQFSLSKSETYVCEKMHKKITVCSEDKDFNRMNLLHPQITTCKIQKNASVSETYSKIMNQKGVITNSI